MLFTTFLAPIVLGVILAEQADLLVPEVRNAHKMCKLLPNAPESQIERGISQTRKVLESWHTMGTPNVDNNSSQLQGQI